jgi:hypothetical protein
MVTVSQNRPPLPPSVSDLTQGPEDEYKFHSKGHKDEGTEKLLFAAFAVKIHCLANLLERLARTNDLGSWINQSQSFSWVYPALAKRSSGPAWRRS